MRRPLEGRYVLGSLFARSCVRPWTDLDPSARGRRACHIADAGLSDLLRLKFYDHPARYRSGL